MAWSITYSESTSSDLVTTTTNNIDSAITSATTTSQYAKATLTSFSNAVTSTGSDLANVADAAGSAALNYLLSKIEAIQTAWTTTTTVSVGALMDEIAPYALDISSAVSKLTTRISSAVGYMLGTESSSWGDLLNDLSSDFITSLTSDAAVIDAVSNMQIIQGVVGTVQTINSVYSTIKSVLNVLEPLFPYLEIAANLALTIWSGGTSALEGTSKTTQTVQLELQKLTTLAMAAIKKVAYSFKIQVPVLLTGVLEQLSVRDAILSYDDSSNVSSWLQSIFDDDFYSTAQSSLTWYTSISEALESTINWFNDSTATMIESIFGDTTWGNTLKTKFLSNLTSSFMSTVVAEAQKSSYHLGQDVLSNWNSYSSLSYDNLDLTGVSVSNATKAYYNEETGEYESSKLDIILANIEDTTPIRTEEDIRLISYNILQHIS